MGEWNTKGKNGRYRYSKEDWNEIKWLEKLQKTINNAIEENISMKTLWYTPYHQYACPLCGSFLVKDYFMHAQCINCDYAFSFSPFEDHEAFMKGLAYEDTQIQPKFMEYSVQCNGECKQLIALCDTKEECEVHPLKKCPVCDGAIKIVRTRDWTNGHERTKYEANEERQRNYQLRMQNNT